MLRIDKGAKKLVRLKASDLAEADHWERQLQEMICADPDTFCEEIGEKLWVIGQEIRPSDSIPDRIDILAVDESGKAVVVELKRGTHKLQLLQAISYAGMVSRWSPDKFIQTLAVQYHQSEDDARSDIEDHTGSDVEHLNGAQRILLIAENFDPALLLAAEWLHEHHDVDVRCYRLSLSQENDVDYLTCTCVYPPIEIATLTRGASSSPQTGAAAWASWDDALEAVDNDALKAFVKAEAGAHQENRISYRELIYRVQGKRRFWLGCRKKYAYVWQWGRFDNDVQFWQKILSEPEHVRPVTKARGLRFHLTTAEDFSAFAKAAKGDLQSASFSESGELAPPSNDE